MDLKTLQNFVDLNSLDTNQKRDANWLLKELPPIPTKKQLKKLESQIKALKYGVPLAYITGHAPFFEYDFFVDKSTLIPRFETELLVDKILKKFQGKIDENFEILDLCAGSGCIGITLQKKLNCKVTLVDLNRKCLKIIKKNAKQNMADVTILKSNMFQKIKGTFDLVVSNPPYIKTDEILTLDKSVQYFEPHMALDGGKDGLDFYRIIAQNAPNFLKPNGILALEIGYDQKQSVPKLLKHNFKDIKVESDYSNLPRFVFAKRS